MKINQIIPRFVETIESELEDGVLYISKEYKTAVHLCACGCKGKTVTPIQTGEWTLIEDGKTVTLRPSIGNFAGEKPYHAHYFITNNKIEWL